MSKTQQDQELVIEDITTPLIQETEQKPTPFEAWYSPNTISTVVQEVEKNDDGKSLIAFISVSPAFYFALKNPELKKRARLFDDDKERWEKDPGFIYFDFRLPNDIPKEHHGQYSYIVVDPASINQEFWKLYSQAVKLLLKQDGKILASTVAENSSLMKELLSLEPVKFIPSIPNLVYHYLFYTNYQSEALNKENQELKEIEIHEDLQKNQEIPVESEKDLKEVEEIIQIRKQAEKLAEEKIKIVEEKGEKKMESNIHWKNNKNLQTLLQKKQPNVAFYSNQMPCIPHGDFIDNIHKNWFGDYHTLEYHHGYIQWLFPNSSDQGQNFYSANLSPEEAKIISSDPEMKNRVLLSFKLFLDFLGLKLTDQGQIERNSNYETRYHSIENSPHNFMRITRVLKSMTELGYPNLRDSLILFLFNEILQNDKLVNAAYSLINYWLPLLPNEEYEKIEKLAKEKDLINQFIQRTRDQLKSKYSESPVKKSVPKEEIKEKKEEKKEKKEELKDPITPFLDKELDAFFKNSKSIQRKVEPNRIVLGKRHQNQPKQQQQKTQNLPENLFQKQKVSSGSLEKFLESLGNQQQENQKQVVKEEKKDKQTTSLETLVNLKEKRLEEFHSRVDPFILNVYIRKPQFQPIQFFNFSGNVSPNGWRVHICLEEKMIPYQIRVLNPMNLDHKSPLYLQINERGKIPSIIDNGVIVTESMAILQYLNERSQKNPLIPKERSAYAMALTRLNQYSNNLDPIYSKIMYKARMLGLKKSQMYEEIYALEKELEFWDEYLEENVWFAGDNFTLCDIAIFPCIAECVYMGLDFDLKFPNIGRWYRFMKRRDSIKKTWPTFMGNQVLCD